MRAVFLPHTGGANAQRRRRNGRRLEGLGDRDPQRKGEPHATDLHHSAHGLGLLGASGAAGTQVFPTRPVTLVVPFPAGGPSDTLARVLAEQMQGALGQPVVVENGAGASGSIGVARVARAAPDGYSLVLGSWVTHVVNGAWSLPQS